MYHYTYLITNTQEEKHYIGSRSCKCLPTDDLGICYFSSSSNKLFVSEQKKNPEKYQYQVLEIFENRKAATESEVSLHQYFDVKNNVMFYNRSNQTSTSYEFSDEVKQEFSNKKKHVFRHKLHGTEICTRWELAQKYKNLTLCGLSLMVCGNTKSHRGWYLNKLPKDTAQKFNFYHFELGNEFCSLKELCKKYKINKREMSFVLAGEYKQYNGWAIDPKNVAKSVFVFYHKDFGQRICNRMELRNEFHNLTNSGLHALVSGRNRSHKGWTVNQQNKRDRPRQR
jgi:hypothetical protein